MKKKKKSSKKKAAFDLEAFEKELNESKAKGGDEDEDAPMDDGRDKVNDKMNDGLDDFLDDADMAYADERKRHREERMRNHEREHLPQREDQGEEMEERTRI